MRKPADSSVINITIEIMRMSRIVVINGLSLAGVMQSPARSDEDVRVVSSTAIGIRIIECF